MWRVRDESLGLRSSESGQQDMTLRTVDLQWNKWTCFFLESFFLLGCLVADRDLHTEEIKAHRTRGKFVITSQFIFKKFSMRTQRMLGSKRLPRRLILQWRVVVVQLFTSPVAQLPGMPSAARSHRWWYSHSDTNTLTHPNLNWWQPKKVCCKIRACHLVHPSIYQSSSSMSLNRIHVRSISHVTKKSTVTSSAVSAIFEKMSVEMTCINTYPLKTGLWKTTSSYCKEKKNFLGLHW